MSWLLKRCLSSCTYEKILRGRWCQRYLFFSICLVDIISMHFLLKQNSIWWAKNFAERILRWTVLFYLTLYNSGVDVSCQFSATKPATLFQYVFRANIPRGATSFCLRQTATHRTASELTRKGQNRFEFALFIFANWCHYYYSDPPQISIFINHEEPKHYHGETHQWQYAVSLRPEQTHPSSKDGRYIGRVDGTRDPTKIFVEILRSRWNSCYDLQLGNGCQHCDDPLLYHLQTRQFWRHLHF